MFEKIEILVSENADAFRSVVASGASMVGVFAGILFVTIFVIWNFWYYFRPDRKQRTFKQEIKEYSLFVTSFTGSCMLILYALTLIAVYTPARYIIAYIALRHMYLL